MIITRYHIFIASALFVALSAALALVSISSQYRETYRLRQYVSVNAVEGRLSGVFAAMNDFPGSAGKDMLFLRTLSSISELYSNFKVETWRLAHGDIQQFIERNVAYDEMHLHASPCMFTARRVSEEKGDTSCVSPNPIIDNAITHTLDLPQGSVYVSPLVAYTRSVLGKEHTIPAILYGTRVSTPGSEDGVIVAVVNANYFLEEVRRLKRPGETVYLVNTDGSYIAHPESGKEMVSGGTANFYEDFPAVSPGTLSDKDVQMLNAKDTFFTFKRITPTASNFALYEKSSGDVADATYWVLVAVSEKNLSGNWFFSLPCLVIIGIVGSAHALVIVLVFFMLFPRIKETSQL